MSERTSIKKVYSATNLLTKINIQPYS